MSDPKSSYGEPVEEPTPVDDVVGRANEGLAEAEAARGEDSPEAADSAADAPSDATPADPDAAETSPEPAAEPIVEEPAVTTPAAPSQDAEQQTVLAGDDAETRVYDSGAPAAAVPEAAEPSASDAETRVYEPAPSDAETTAYTAAPATTEPAAEPAAAPYMGQPIFVQAPEAPRPRGNRAAAGAIGLLAAVSFAVLYLAAWLGFGAITGDVDGANVGTTALDALATWSFWVPVVVFFLAFWLLGAIINRGRWGAWVIFGLLVGFAAYGGHILGQLFQAPFWMLTASEGAQLVESQLLAPLAIAALVFGRELTIWFGAWAASRGKRVTELNIEAQREYERTLEAGPQLVRQ